MNNPTPVLKVDALSIGVHTGSGVLALTENVSFEVNGGEIFGLVGESGCGKSITAMAMLKLLPQPGGVVLNGRVLLNGDDILVLEESALCAIRGKRVSMIFQEPGSALDPLLTVEKQLMECFHYHPFKGDKVVRVQELMTQVGFSDSQRVLKSYPHELSGGMAQRVMIAMALMLKPDVIIADEPTTALDVTIQAQIMELLTSLQRELGVSILLITHNLGLIAQYAHRLAIMYAGRIVEQSTVAAFLKQPLHPYTRGLVNALPNLWDDNNKMEPIPGTVPQPADFASGCRFKERCPRAMPRCSERPQLRSQGHEQKVACFLYDGLKGDF